MVRRTRTNAIQLTLPFAANPHREPETPPRDLAAELQPVDEDPWSPPPAAAPPPLTLPELLDPTPHRLLATVRRVRFESAATGFAVLAVASKGRTLTAVGPLAGFRTGEELALTGRWIDSPRFGEQFRVTDVEAIAATSLDGIRAHLEDCPVAGVGPKLAQAIVTALGLQTWDVLAAGPERAAEVPGVRAGVAEALHAYARDHRDLAQLASLLRKGGVGLGTARRVHAFYRARGADPVAVVTADPYQAARDVDRIGFERADRIASALGLPRSDPSRIRAGLRHVLSRAAESAGHCLLPRPELLDAAAKLLALPPQTIEPVLADLLEDPAELVQPDRIVADGDAIYLSTLLDAECTIARRIPELLGHAPAVVDSAIDGAIARAQAAHAGREADPASPDACFTFNEAQRRAIHLLATTNVMIVTGGPGTGKTTLVQGLVAVLDELDIPVSLAAPTGRAAQRLRETTGRSAATVHRLLGWDPETNAFRPRGGSISGALIVDEFSMMDVWLSGHLLNMLEPGAPLVLVGDVDQLPSVGPGAVLRHLIDSGVVPTVRLEVPIRQAAGSRHVANAHRVNRGEEPEFPADDPECGWIGLDELPGEDAAELVIDEALRMTRAAAHPFEFQVLSPMKRGPLGIDALNAALQERLNPAGPPELRHGGIAFRAEDKVIQVRNDHDRGVMNGEVGRVIAVDPKAGRLQVAFRTRDAQLPHAAPVTYGAEELEHLRLAYAVTIHKSQGSEYDAVLVVLHDSHLFMLQRNLLYTALTRARRRVVVAGTAKALRRAVKNARIAERHARLTDRLRAQVANYGIRDSLTRRIRESRMP